MVMLSTFDVNPAYWKTKIIKLDRNKAAVKFRHKNCCYERMPSKIEHSSGIFQRVVNDVLANVAGLYVVVYLGDSVFFVRLHTYHIGHVRHPLTSLRQEEITLELRDVPF